MARISIQVTHPANRRMLAETLGVLHELILGDGTACQNQAPDLIILDGPAYAKCAAAIENARQQAAPAVLPVILILSSTTTGLSTHNLWEKVEDILHTPLNKAE